MIQHDPHNPHPKVESLFCHSPHSPTRWFRHISECIDQQMPRDPAINQEPVVYAVGSFVLDPENAKDLDIEISNVTWEHLQEFFADKAGTWGIKDVQLTKAGDDGIIDSNRGDFGNAYVAVWLTIEGDRPGEEWKVNLSIPMRVSADSTRYDRNSVEYVPTLDFAEASKRRDFAHKALGYNRMVGSYGEIVDPHNGRACLEDSQPQLKLLNPEAYKKDPIGLYRAITEMLSCSTRGRIMRPDGPSNLVLREMAKQDLSKLDAASLRPKRIEAARESLFTSDSPPSLCLMHAISFGLVERDFGDAGVLLGQVRAADEGRDLFIQMNEATNGIWGYCKKEGLTGTESLGRVLSIMSTGLADAANHLGLEPIEPLVEDGKFSSRLIAAVFCDAFSNLYPEMKDEVVENFRRIEGLGSDEGASA